MSYSTHPNDVAGAIGESPIYPHEADLAAYLVKILELPETDRLSIYSFRDKDGGYRIAEISTFRPDPVHGLPYGGGGSWMASDVDAAAILFAAERFVIGRGEPIIEHDDENYTDFEQEDERALYYAIHGKFPDAWEDRRPAKVTA